MSLPWRRVSSSEGLFRDLCRIDGEDLKKIIARGPMPIPEIKKLAIHVVTAIDDLWNCDPNHRIIHRDLKPANIMRRTGTGQYGVLDIGMALDLLASPISDPGQIPGTARYFTSEQLVSAKKWQMDFRTDMLALGLILYEVATLRPLQMWRRNSNRDW